MRCKQKTTTKRSKTTRKVKVYPTKEVRQNGYLIKVLSSGNKPKLGVAQALTAPKGKPWVVRLYNSPFTVKGYGRTAESLARNWAKKGHKEVKIMD